MLEFNRILLQLDKAVHCANSKHTQDKAMAVTLFDNLIEIQLYKRAEFAFAIDRTTWYGGKRKFDKSKRRETASKEGKYDKLLKFSKDQKLLSEKDFELLKYVHTIRNAVYHRGELDELKLDLAIIIYYGFLKTTLHKWGNPSWLISYPGNYSGTDEIDFGQGLSRDKGLSFDHSKYFSGALDSIFSRLQIALDIRSQASYVITEQVKQIKDALEFIAQESKSINFYAVLGRYWYLNDDFFRYQHRKRKPKNIDSILILYSFLHKYREYLNDIPDLRERQKQGRKLLRIHRRECKEGYPHWVDLDRILNRVSAFKNKDDHAIMKSLMDIEDKISFLYTDATEAAYDLDNHIQDLVDIARGK